MKNYLAMLFAVTLLLLQGCAFEAVKPWNRDALAQNKMQLTPDAVESMLDEHIFFSKEASSGGSGVGGGGCGCN
jgi:hypothetical protein